MVSLWTLKTIANAVGSTCGTDADVGGISIDTRTLNKGDLFVALRDVRDGHDFVADALAKGAAAALVSRDVAGAPSNRLIKVDDTLSQLAVCADVDVARKHMWDFTNKISVNSRNRLEQQQERKGPRADVTSSPRPIITVAPAAVERSVLV